MARFEQQAAKSNGDALGQGAWEDLAKAAALSPGGKAIGVKLKEVEAWLAARKQQQRQEEQRPRESGEGRSKYSADYSRFDDFAASTDSDEEAEAASVAKERLGRLAKLEELQGMIERSGDDQLSLDKAMDWVAAAAKDNEGRRITLNLTTPDGSRRASFGIGMRAHLTKLMPRFAAMLPADDGGSARTAESLRFESSGRTLKVRPCPLVGCSRVGL